MTSRSQSQSRPSNKESKSSFQYNNIVDQAEIPAQNFNCFSVTQPIEDANSRDTFQTFSILNFEDISHSTEFNQAEYQDYIEEPHNTEITIRKQTHQKEVEYCFFCGQEVQGIHIIAFHDKQTRRYYNVHEQCKSSMNPKYRFISSLGMPPSKITTFDDGLVRDSFKIKNEIGCKHFYADIKFTHPCSDLIFFTVQKKVSFVNNQLLICFQNQDKPSLYEPNIIAIPFLNFRVSVMLEIGLVEAKYQTLVFLDEWIKQEVNFIGQSNDCLIVGKRINDKSQKQQCINKMNYKFDRLFENNAIVLISCMKFQLKQFELKKLIAFSSHKIASNVILSDTDQQSINSLNYYPNSPYQNSYNSSMQHFPPQYQANQFENIATQYYNSGFEQYPPYYNYPNYQNYEYYDYGNYSPVQNLKLNKNVDEDHRIVNEWIKRRQIITQAKSNAGSRIIQKYLKKANQEQINYFIENVYEDLQVLIIDSYGNYTFQQLVNVSTTQKKLLLISKIFQHIPFIAKTKQGTHALQTLVSTLTNQNQYKLIIKGIKDSLLELSKDVNAIHFIQKVITFLNQKDLGFFVDHIVLHFLHYAVDPQGVLAIKSIILKRFDEVSEQKIIIAIQDNLETIILDPYGNYIVQAAYQTYKQQKLLKVNKKIIQKFVAYCIQRYASNVVINCLQEYCSKDFLVSIENTLIKSKTYQQILKTLSGQHIIKILYNRSENKIFIEDVKNVLSLERMSKHRWSGFEQKTPKNEAQTTKFANSSTFMNAVQEKVNKEGFVKKQEVKYNRGSKTPRENINKFKNTKGQKKN